MQIHIHKDGKTFGPYTLEQVRQFLKAGNFTGNDLACHDGANWIKLSQEPGIAPIKPKTIAKQVEQPAKVKTKTRLIHLPQILTLALRGAWVEE